MSVAIVVVLVVVVVLLAFSASPLAGILVLGLAIYAVFKLSGRGKGDRGPQSTSRGHSHATSLTSTVSDHQPPPPKRGVIRPWSGRTQHYEVAGEFYRSANIQRLFQGQPIRQDGGAELQFPAHLVPDPGNPHDHQAVAVFVRGEHVGYLERAVAQDYFVELAALADQNLTLEVQSRQWARFDGYRRDLFSRVTLQIPAPHAIKPVNDPPSDGVVLPTGSTIQVTKEDQYMDTIIPWLDPIGGEVTLAVTLHAVVDIRPRSTVDLVQVRIDDQPVGVLSPASTANLLPLVKFIEERSKTTVARATLKGNALKADITVHVAKAQDVDPAWIATLGSLP